MHRFFAPTFDPGDETVTLPRDEAQHLSRVLRLSVGDTVSVFNWRGAEFLSRVIAADRQDVRVQLVSRIEPATEPTVAITLVQAVLKGEKMDDVIRDAVMLGVSAVRPIITARAETTVAAILRSARLERWKRVAVASVKQSRRAIVPEIRTPLSFEVWLNEPHTAAPLMLVEPAVSAEATSLSVLRGEPTPQDAEVVVGPEGGWTDAEWQAAQARGIRLMTLGQRTLRADAVAVAAVSVLQFLWENL